MPSCSLEVKQLLGMLALYLFLYVSNIWHEVSFRIGMLRLLNSYLKAESITPEDC